MFPSALVRNKEFEEAAGERLKNYLAHLAVTGEVPAPLDEVSLHNGILKFLHEQVLFTEEDWRFCMVELEREFGAVTDMGEMFTTEEDIIAQIRPDRASGYPFNFNVDQTKGGVIEKIGLYQLLSHESKYQSIIGVTQKDELRPRGKDARVFRPAPVDHVVLGIALFGQQAQSLALNPDATVSAIGLNAQGLDLVRLWNDIMSYPTVISGDGGRFDASFPLEITRIIAITRLRSILRKVGSNQLTLHLKDGDFQLNITESVSRYYTSAYNGYSNVGGKAVHLVGNPSGHYLTSDDNTRCEFLGVALALRKLHIPYDTVKLKVMGDDFILGSKFDINKLVLAQTGELYGFHWEILADGVNPVFIGTEPVQMQGWYYPYSAAYDPSKLLCSMLYKHKGATDLDHFQKACAICTLLRYTEWYEDMRAAILVMMKKLPTSPEVVGVYASCGPLRTEQQYLGQESVIFSDSQPDTARCVFTKCLKGGGLPFKDFQMAEIPAKIPDKALERFGSITQPAKNWLTMVLDPFHDYQFDHIAGYPGLGSVRPSVVQFITKNYTISKPAGAPAGAWQACVFYTGLTGGGGTVGSVRSANEHLAQYSHTAPTAKNIGPVMIMADGMATEMIPDFTQGVLNDNPGSTTPYRVIAVGIEVHNTTAEIYRGGSVTTGILQPWTKDDDAVVYQDTTATVYADRWMTTDTLAGVPVSETQLRVIPSARTWNAADGVYMVPRLYEEPTSNSYWQDRNTMFEFQSTGNKYYHTQPASVTSTLVNYPAFQGMTVSGFSPMMASFTGLSDQTTLTVTFKTAIESFPEASSVLAPLATPGCPFDAEALRAYAAISAESPYAVKVGDNAAGDFFRSIIQVAKAAAPALGLIPHVGGALKSAAPMVLGLAEKIADTWQKDQSGKLESVVDAKALGRYRSQVGQALRGKKKKVKKNQPNKPNQASISGTVSK